MSSFCESFGEPDPTVLDLNDVPELPEPWFSLPSEDGCTRSLLGFGRRP